MKGIVRLLTLIHLILLAACSGAPENQTKIRHQLIIPGAIGAASNQQGGVMVYGRSDSGLTFAKLFDGSDIFLENDNWTFYFIGWDGDDQAGNLGLGMVGKFRCGISSASLSGGEQEITVSMASANCASDEFGRSETKNGSYEPHPLHVYTCYTTDGVVTNDTACIQSLGESYQIKFNDFAPDGSVFSSGLTSACVSNLSPGIPPADAAGPGNTSDVLKVPLLALPGILPHAEIITYDQQYCAGSSQTLSLPLGLRLGLAATVSSKGNNSDAVELFVKHNACDFSAGNQATPFFISSQSTYILCDSSQFTYVNANATNKYHLGKDIDFGGAVVANAIVTNPFSGEFDGRGFTISNINFTVTGTNNIGLFSLIHPNPGPDPEIEDLTLQNISFDVTDLDYAGALAGRIHANAGGDIRIENIVLRNISFNIHDSDTTIHKNYGALTGSTDNTIGSGSPIVELNNISLDGVTFLLDDYIENVGGITGGMDSDVAERSVLRHVYAQNITLSKSGPLTNSGRFGGAVGDTTSSSAGPDIELFDVSVVNLTMGSNGTPLNPANGFVGGVVGFFNGGPMSNIRSSGTMFTNTDDVGGIAGSFQGLNAKNILSSMTLENTGDSTGGLFGNVHKGIGPTSYVIELVRFTGSLECVGTGCGGLIGELDDTAGAFSLDLKDSFQIGQVTLTSGSGLGGFIGIVNMSTGGTMLDFNDNYSSGTLTSNALQNGGVIGSVTSASGPIDIFHMLIDAQMNDLGGSNRWGGIYGEIVAPLTNYTGGDHIIVAASVPNVTDRGRCAGEGGPPTGDLTNSEFVSSITADAGNGSSCFDGGGITDLAQASVEGGSFGGSIAVNTQWALDDNNNYALKNYHLLDKVSLNEVGSSTDPLLIYTPDQWNEISDHPMFMNKAFKLMSDLDFSQVSAIDNFNPIGSIANCFHGVLQGHNYALLNMDLDDSSTEPLGIFRMMCAPSGVNGARVEHVDVFDESIEYSLYIDGLTLHHSNASAGAHTGGLVGEIDDNPSLPESVVIENVHMTNSTISSEGNLSGQSIGGLIGIANFDNNNSELFRLSFDGTVDVTTNYLNGVNHGIGGIIGSLTGGPGNLIRMDELSNYGDIGTLGVDNDYTGGVIGNVSNSNVSFEIAQNFGNVHGQDDVGGVVGKLSNGQFLQSRSVVGQVTGTNSRVGGIAGSIFLNGSITTSYSESIVDAGVDYAGGLFGRLMVAQTNPISNNYVNSPSVTSPATVHYFGSIAGTNFSNNYYVDTDALSTPVGGQFEEVTVTELIDPTSNISNINSGVGVWVLQPGDAPRLYYEIFPELLDLDDDF